MHKIDGENHDNNTFTGGDPLIPRGATHVTPAWLNAVQGELVAVVEAAGIALNKLVNTQLRDALFALFGRLGVANTWSQPNSFTAINASGTSTLNGPTVLNGGLRVNDVSGVASINGVGATHTASGAAMPTKYIFEHAAMPAAAGGNYPLVSLAKMTAGNLVGLNTRARAVATVGNWTHVRLGLSMDVDGTMGSGGQLWWGPNGVEATGPTTSTGAAPANAFTLTNGNLSLDGVANPNKDVPVKNALTPRNISKVSASISTSGTGSVQTDDGFNVGGVTLSSGRVVLAFAQPFADALYQVALSSEDFPSVVQVKHRAKAAGSVEFAAYNGAGTLISMATQPVRFDVMIIGRQ
ncbi:hypothetical protein [Archangium violaceum]|uniref:hypothetical protein n=1 Tax=Archangium violaceum TaxID=83451 RepID=UPI0036DBB576